MYKKLSALVIGSSLALTSSALAQYGLTKFDGKVYVPNSVMKAVGQMLPERNNGNVEYTKFKYTPNIELVKDTEVLVSFMWEGAGYRNTLGYFTYTQSSSGDVNIIDKQLIFPNVSQSNPLRTGYSVFLRDSKSKIRKFKAGTKIGFFVVANGFKQSVINNWKPDSSSPPFLSPELNAKAGSKGTFTSIDELNPEVSTNASKNLWRHAITIFQEGQSDFLSGNSYTITSFEDLRRDINADHDFNDVIFVTTTRVKDAINPLGVFTATTDDLDGDGLTGIDDQFPKDPERASTTVTPNDRHAIVAVEDLYPGLGDRDFNDLVLAYKYYYVLDSKGYVKDLVAEYHLPAKGASFNHEVGVHFPKFKKDLTGKVSIERFLSDTEATHEVVKDESLQSYILDKGSRFIIFPYTENALEPLNYPDGKGRIINTYKDRNVNGSERSAASARVKITFDKAVKLKDIGEYPYDIYFTVFRDPSNPTRDRYDMHFNRRPGIS